MEDIMQNENWINRAYTRVLIEYKHIRRTGKYESAFDIVQEGVYNFLKLNRDYESYEHLYLSMKKSIYYVLLSRFTKEDKRNRLTNIVLNVPNVVDFETIGYNDDNLVDEITVEIKKGYPLLNLYCEGYNQEEIGEFHGYSQRWASKWINKEIESLKKELNV
jgi:DNA-directed RNA polymerase specialized sigma24 family protein